MSDPAVDVIGKHVSDIPGAIPDVWPVIDELGVVVALVRTWDDASYVRLDHDGIPVDQIGQTHHLMPRLVFQDTMLPQEWTFVGARRVSRGLTKVQFRPGGNRDDSLGDGQEFDVLVELNAGAGSVTDEIDTCPPYTHVVELRGEFYLVERRPAPEGSGEAGPDAPAACDEPAAAESAAAARALAGSNECWPSSASLADWIEAAAAEEATLVSSDEAAERAREANPIVAAARRAASIVAARPEAAPVAVRRSCSAADLLKAIADPDDAAGVALDAAPALQADVARPVRGRLASEMDEGIWEAPGATPEAPPAPPAGPAPAARGAATLLSEMPEDEDLESMRASSYAQATAFVTSAAAESAEATDGVLTLEQVRDAGCFAWDEFMNLYLPHVGFAAAKPASTPAAGGGPPEVAFIPRAEADVRPIGWHHLAGCACQHCQP